MEYRLLAAALTAIAFMFLTIRTTLRHEDARRSAADRALTAVIAGLVAGRLAAMLLTGTNPLIRPADILIVRGGVDPVWASLGAVATVAVVARRHLWTAIDTLAPAALAALSGWHAACAVRGACLGTPSDLPWAMTEPGGVVARHPVEVYAAVLFAASAVGVELWRRRGAASGLVGLGALTLAPAVRLVTEPMRPTLGAGRASAYLTGALIGAAALAARAVLARRSGPARRSPSVHS